MSTVFNPLQQKHCIQMMHYTTTTTTVLLPFFPDHPGELVPEENFWTSWCKERLTEAETPTRSIQTNQCQPPPSIFYRPDALPAAQPTASKHLLSIINSSHTHARTHTHNRFMALFPGLRGWASARRNLLLDFMVQQKINRGRHTDHPARHHSIRTNQRPTSNIPQRPPGCPSCCNSPTLSWLGTGTKYAGLLT